MSIDTRVACSLDRSRPVKRSVVPTPGCNARASPIVSPNLRTYPIIHSRAGRDVVAMLGVKDSPRIHGELLKLGFHLAEPTVSRWLRRIPRNPDSAKRWLAFLRNHREALAAMDFSTVPTLTFGVLYCIESECLSHLSHNRTASDACVIGRARRLE